MPRSLSPGPAMRKAISSPAIIALLIAAAAAPAHGQEAAPPAEASQPVEMSAAELFDLADAARGRGDHELAERAYRALAEDPDPELRSEARYRLARMLADDLGRHRDAATLLRRILDEKPDAAGVRLELARMQAELGNLSEARRELRAVQAGGVPPQVEQLIRFYANALSARKRMGGSVQIAFAPSNNINRATSNDTLGTIIGDFTLDEDAQAQSGIGLALRGQTYYRAPLGKQVDLLLRASGNADIYRAARFDDFSASFQAGPQWRWGRDRFSLAAATSWRWYGLDPYSFTYGVTGNWQHPLGDRTQLRIDGGILRDDNRRNDLQDSTRYSFSAGIDHALSARAGGGLQFSGSRDVASDPGYSTASGGVDGFLFREIGQTTAVLNLGYRHLEADRRLFLYPKRRVDDRFSASLSGTFRALSFGTFAPLLRLRYERNLSSVGIYDFNRLAGEFGIVSAF